MILLDVDEVLGFINVESLLLDSVTTND